ncbi:MAG: fatty acid-binding protein DegV [Firmicutes bacterium HGW-Firmicutes-1]|jgi:DegV family protein with EDD domain|nr:MAG: fatty acid-binding protein DegV [Firmicutes bacterium HGW-Firmicutes-1]
MSKIAIVSDSACDLPSYIVEKYDIKILPLRVIYENAEYRDGIDIQPQEVYDRLEEEIPKTSLPEPVEVIELFDKLVGEGYTDVVCIALSAKLSGTYNLMQLIANDYDQQKLNIKVVDSKTLSMILGFIVLEAAMKVKDSGTIDEVLSTISIIRNKIQGCYVLKTLKFLKKGGRIGKVEGTVGELLDIKPIIGIDDEGAYYTIHKARGRKKSIQKIKDLIEDHFKGKLINISIIHGGAEEEATSLLEYVKKLYNINQCFITQISPALGVHTGPGLIGYTAYEV